jgi:hypothetical protein
MPINAGAVMSRARTILQDGGAVRWPLAELANWLSDGMREIVNRKPSEGAQSVVLTMAQGTKQTLPDTYLSLIRAVRNVTGVTPNFIGGLAVTPIVREILDTQSPNWHDPALVVQRLQVRHIIADPLDQRTFYVYPGNLGTGKLECIVSVIPLPVTITGGDDPEDIASYNSLTLAMNQIYQTALLDFVLYRAFSKDMQFAGALDRATAHFNQFNAAIMARIQLDAQYNINTTNSQPNS